MRNITFAFACALLAWVVILMPLFVILCITHPGLDPLHLLYRVFVP